MSNWLKKNILSRPIAFHPILFAAFPALFLYAYNVSVTATEHLFVPLTLSVLGTVCLWMLLGLITRDMRKAALAATLLVILFFSYGRLYEALESWNIFVPKHAYLLSVVLFAWGYCVYFIKKSRRDFKNVTLILNIVATALVAINLFNIGWYEFSKPRLNQESMAQTDNQTFSDNTTGMESMPDIYLIVLDEFAHHSTMEKYYGYYNDVFLQAFRDKGFYISNGSTTRTGNTVYSIASTLNMEYIGPDQPVAAVYKQIADNKVVEFLRSRGYKYIYFGSWFDYGKYRIDADQYYNYYQGDTWVAEFSQIFWNTTMLRPFSNRISGTQASLYYRNGLLNTVYKMETSVDAPGPKFVFAHIMCPHAPYIIGSNGEFVDPSNWYNYRDKQYYRGQYDYILHRIYSAVNNIISNSTRPPIIIIQSDHGLKSSHPGINVGQNEWEKILNMYYFPGEAKSALYDNVSPADSFRLIFNQYFHAGLPLLKD